MRNGFIVTDEVAKISRQKTNNLINLIKNLLFSVKDSGGEFPALHVYQRKYYSTQRRIPRDYGFQIDGEDFAVSNKYSFVLDVSKKKFGSKGSYLNCLDRDIVFYKNYFFLLVTPDHRMRI